MATYNSKENAAALKRLLGTDPEAELCADTIPMRALGTEAFYLATCVAAELKAINGDTYPWYVSEIIPIIDRECGHARAD